MVPGEPAGGRGAASLKVPLNRRKTAPCGSSAKTKRPIVGMLLRCAVQFSSPLFNAFCDRNRGAAGFVAAFATGHLGRAVLFDKFYACKLCALRIASSFAAVNEDPSSATSARLTVFTPKCDCRVRSTRSHLEQRGPL